MGFSGSRHGRGAVAAVIVFLLAGLLGTTAARAATANLASPDEYRIAQEYMLRCINEQRAKHGLAAVELDREASKVARAFCEDMLARDFFSHWDMNGLKPTRRWNMQGGYDALSENIYYQYGRLADTRQLVDESMEKFMGSEGHRRTILTPEHTHVGIGFSIDPQSRRFYTSQEFVTRLGGGYSCPLKCKVGERVPLQGQIDTRRYELENVIVGYEELPQPRDRNWLSKTQEYRDADKLVAGYSDDRRIRFNNLQTYHDLAVAEDGSFTCDALLDYKGKEGLYYLFVWLRDKQTDESVLAAVATVEATR